MADPALQDKIATALRLQFENVPQAARDEGEKLLNEFAASSHLMPVTMAILVSPAQKSEVKKAACIFLEKKLTSLCNIKELSTEELVSFGQYLIEALCSDAVQIEMKPYLQSCIQSLTFTQVSENFMWLHFVPAIWKLVAQLNPSILLGVLKGLTAIVMGSSSMPIPEPDPDSFLSKIVELGKKLRDEFDIVKYKNEPIVWEILKSYMLLFQETIRLAVRKEDLSWIAYLLNSEDVCSMVRFFVVAGNNTNSFGPKAVHYLNTQDVLIGEYIPDIRQAVLESLIELTSNSILRPQMKKKEFYRTSFKSLITDVAEVIVASLLDTSNHPKPIYTIIETSQKVEQVITSQLKFLSKICTKDNYFYSVFLNYSELLFKLVILPIARESPAEKEKLETDAKEFVNYSLDLIGFHRSEMPKTEALGLFEYMSENVDGAMTKYFNVLFGILTEMIDETPGPFLQELQTIDKLKSFTRENWIDVSMLLLSDVCYLVSSREDLIQQLKGFVLGRMNKLLSFSSPLLAARTLLFFSQYTEFIMNTYQDQSYMKQLIGHIASCMTNENVPEVVSATAVECVNIIFKEDLVSNSKLLESILSEQIADLVKGVLNSMRQNDNDAFFPTLETIFQNFSKPLCKKNPEIVEALVTTLAQIVARKMITCSMQAENYAIRCLGLADLILEKAEPWLEEDNLGDKLERALIPALSCLKSDTKSDIDIDIVELLNQIIVKRKRLTPTTLEFAEVAITTKLLNNSNANVIYKTINCFLFYGKTLLVNHSKIIEYIVKNLDTEDVAESSSKYYIIQSIIENTESFATTELIKACMQYFCLINDSKKNNWQKIDQIHYVPSYGIVLAGLVFKPQETITFLEKNALQDKLMQDLMSNYTSYNTCLYDKRLYFFGLASLLLQPSVPQWVAIRILKIVSLLIALLSSPIEVPKYNNKVIVTADGSDEGSGSDEDDSSDEFEDDEDDFGTLKNRSDQDFKKDFLSVLKEKDCYKVFRLVLKRILANKSMSELAKALPKDQSHQLKTLAFTSSVVLTDGTKADRKVYSIKRINPHTPPVQPSPVNQ